MKVNALVKRFKIHCSSDGVHIGLNTSPLTDIEAFSFLKNKEGVYYPNAGVFPIMGLAGGNNTQKTGKLVFDISRILFRYSKSIIFYYDTESTLMLERLGNMVDTLYGIDGYFEDNILGKRFVYIPASSGSDATATHRNIIEFIKGMIELRDSKDKKDKEEYQNLLTKTPFWSEEANDYISIPGPFLFACDSITETTFDKLALKQFEEGEIDDGGKKRTRDMEIGNLRRILMEDVCRLGPRVGLYSYWVAQTADRISMDGKPLEKETGFMRQGKKISAPKVILRLPHIGREIIKGTVLKQSDGNLTYPSKKYEGITDVKKNPDLIEYLVTIYRNKIGKSGYSNGFVASQEEGINEDLSMYRILVQEDYYGLPGSKQSHECALLPGLKFGRTTVRDLLEENSKLRRAITICFHLWYMTKMCHALPERLIITPDKLYTLIKEQGHDWDELLNTIDYWHDNPEFIKEKTLTIVELLEIAVDKKPIYWKEKK